MIRKILATAVLAAGVATSAHALIDCTLNGAPIHPDNGNDLIGKTGLMRCMDTGNGKLQREEELRNGRFVGQVRMYRQGILYREFSVNERGNKDGLFREYAATSGANPLLQEETFSNARSSGLTRSWYHNGKLRRASARGADGQEQAVAEFNEFGELTDLRCASTAMLAPEVDDAKLCGYSGVSQVQFAGRGGAPGARATFEAGVRTRFETLFANGHPRDQQEQQGKLWIERSFGSDGNKRHETQWQVLEKGRRVMVLEQQYFENGQLRSEERFTDGMLASEQLWYANGQQRSRADVQRVGADTQRYVRQYNDNGKLAFEGLYKVLGRFDEQPIGVHRRYDDEGRLRAELHHNARGRVSRERILDEAGTVVRDEELLEDGSRKRRGK